MILLNLEFNLMIFLKDTIINNLDNLDLIIEHHRDHKNKKQYIKKKDIFEIK
jgi:hypothetical protein